jgi:hypothetical protein
LDEAERRYVLDTVLEGVPYDQREAEIRRLRSGLPRRPTAVNGRPGRTPLAELDGVTVYQEHLDQVRVTLLEFGAPDVTGCRVTMGTSTTERVTPQFSAAFRGAKVGRKAEVKTTFETSFPASAGERKRVFADVPVRVTRVFELRNSVLRPTWLATVEPLGTRASAISVPGIESIPAEQPPLAKYLAPFKMAGDTSGAIITYTHIYEVTREASASLGHSFKGVNIGGSLTIGVSLKVTLALALTAGHDYDLYATENDQGIGWTFT